MKTQVLILSEDAVFARMLELEFLMQHLKTAVSADPDTAADAEVILLDLDTVPPPTGAPGRIIGFTKSFSLTETDTARACSMILHRPFEVRILRNEVLALISSEGGRKPSKPQVPDTLNLQGNRLFYGEASVSLSPNEAAVIACLLARRGDPVSREALGAHIGATDTNKVDVYICYLRRKLATLCDRPLIRTVRGKGYCIES